MSKVHDLNCNRKMKENENFIHVKQIHQTWHSPNQAYARRKEAIVIDMPDVDIAGFRQIVNRSKPFWWRFLWTIIAVSTLLGCGYQCGDRLQRYLDDPSDVNTYYVENKTLTFPSATVCPWSGYDKIPSLNFHFYKKQFGSDTTRSPEDLLKSENITILDLWELSRLDRNWTTFGSYTVRSLDNQPIAEEVRVTISDTYTVYGKCTTFIAYGNVRRSGVQSDKHIFLQGENAELSHFMINYHSYEQTDLVRYITYNSGIIYPFDSTDFFLRATELVYRNTRKNPCSNDDVAINKCTVDCIENGVYARLKKKCRLPYMQNSHVIKPCKTAEEFTDVVSVTRKVVGNFQRVDCNCSKKCREIIYSTEFVGSSLKFRKKNVLRLWMGFSNPRITVIQEVASYNGFALFSDLGGSIGLYLGISALQTFEILAAAFSKIAKHYNGRLNL